jgi:hypothetical protein
MTDIAGNTFATALDIELLSSLPQIFTDEIGALEGTTLDNYDYYRFRLQNNSAVSIKLSGLSNNAQLYLYSSDGVSKIASSVNGSNTDESIDRNLSVGTYYILVSSDSATSYQLGASANRLGSYQDDAGDTFGTARDIGVLDGFQVFND